MNEKLRLVLYTKPGCHLCDEMKEAIRAANCKGLYKLQEVNIESDAELFARYRYDIPVLIINGVEAFRHRLTTEEFKARIKQSQS